MKTKTTISMALFFALLICTVNVSATWWDNSWEYKKEVTITEQSGSDLTNYQIKIELNTTPLYDGGKLQSQCQDVRFINGSENAELDFWIEECITNNNSKNSIFWVEVPSITASSTETIYVYYGNSGASSASNGTNTFDFFDDLEYSDDPSNHGWTDALGNAQTSTEQAKRGSRSIKLVGGGGFSDRIYRSRSGSQIIEMDYYDVSDNANDQQFVFFTGTVGSYSTDISIGVNGYSYADTQYIKYIGGTPTNFGTRSIGWHSLKVVYDGSKFNVYWDGSHEIVDASYTLTQIYLYTSGQFQNLYIDSIRIHKYTSTEPTYSIENEESSNQAPSNPNPSITPSTVYTNTDIVCTAIYIDPDGDNGTLNFTILVNNTPKNTCDYSLGNNIQKTCNLSSGNYSRNQVINCTVTATDNNSKSTTSSTTKTVQNSPPTTPTTLTPTSGTYTTSVTINCSGSTDNDSDTVYYDIETNITGKWTTLEDNGDGYYVWSTSSYTQDNVGLRCRATDLTDNSSYTPTVTINIDNTAPSINLNATLSDYNTILDRVWAYIEFYSDSTLNACLVDWNGTNESMKKKSENICYKNKTSLSIGNYTFRGWVNDSVGNWNYTDEYWIYINATTTTTTSTTTTTIPYRGGGGWGSGTPNVAKVIKVPTCDDGIQNQGEEGIDCGGPCSPCKAPTTTIKAITTTTTLKATTTTTTKATTTTTTKATTTTIRTTTTTISTEGGVALATTAIVILAFILFAGIIVYLMRMK